MFRCAQHRTERGVKVMPGRFSLLAGSKEMHIGVPCRLRARVAQLLGHEFDVTSLIDQDARKRVSTGVRRYGGDTRRAACRGERLEQLAIPESLAHAVCNNEIVVSGEPCGEPRLAKSMRDLRHQDDFAA